MADYKGNTCPVCKQKFKEADDIVVCPDCGTPYHRECWKKVGVCVHQADHAAGFEWTPDNVISDRPDDIVCPNCGETVYVSEDDLDAGEANCAHCGVTFEVALEGDEDEAKDAPVQYEVTCPACGATAVFEEGDLLDGEPTCPNCGKPLDFEVTEE